MEYEDAKRFCALMGLKGSAETAVLATSKSENLKFFIVENSARKREFVLAQNGKFAASIARDFGHVKDIKNARILEPTEKFWSDCRGFRGAVEKAIADRRPGRLVRRGEFAVLGDEVYTPIGIAR